MDPIDAATKAVPVPIWMQGGIAVVFVKLGFDLVRDILKMKRNGKAGHGEDLESLNRQIAALLEDHRDVARERRELTQSIRDLVGAVRSIQERNELLYPPSDMRLAFERIRDIHVRTKPAS